MRLIDAEILKQKVTSMGTVYNDPYELYDNCLQDVVNQIDDLLDNLPTVDPVKRGKWIENEDSGTICCSCCGMEAFYRDNSSWFDDHEYEGGDDGSGYVLSDFCPWCGADLRE